MALPRFPSFTMKSWQRLTVWPRRRRRRKLETETSMSVWKRYTKGFVKVSCEAVISESVYVHTFWSLHVPFCSRCIWFFFFFINIYRKNRDKSGEFLWTRFTLCIDTVKIHFSSKRVGTRLEREKQMLDGKLDGFNSFTELFFNIKFGNSFLSTPRRPFFKSFLSLY